MWGSPLQKLTIKKKEEFVFLVSERNINCDHVIGFAIFQLNVNKLTRQLCKECVKRKPKMHQVLIFAKILPLHVKSVPDNSATIEPRITHTCSDNSPTLIVSSK